MAKEPNKYPPRKKAITDNSYKFKRRFTDYGALKCRGPSPEEETTYSIPILSGKFYEVFWCLKEQAFKKFLELDQRKVRIKPPIKKHQIYYGITGFMAFKAFYAHEFYNLPHFISAKYFTLAWNSCDCQHLWNFYAAQYRRYVRTENFLEWLLHTRKEGTHPGLIFISHF